MYKMPSLTRKSGFTIVELLIVIVIIAILSAITVVAYNGITNRANTSTIITHMRQWEKIFESYIINKDRPPQANWRCLGDATTLPAANGYAENFCFKPTNLTAGGGTSTTAPADPALMQLLMNENPGTKLPNTRFPEAKGFYSNSDEGYQIRTFRGVFYDGSTNNFADNPAIIAYYAKSQTCPIGERVSGWSQWDDANTSACAIKLSVNEHGQKRGVCNIVGMQPPGPNDYDYALRGYTVLDGVGTPQERGCQYGEVVTRTYAMTLYANR